MIQAEIEVAYQATIMLDEVGFVCWVESKEEWWSKITLFLI